MAKDAKENRGRVSLVGAGPGDPGLVTVRALERLREADLVLHDELVSVELLSWVPEAAVTENVGKRGHEQPRYSQEEINERLVDAAREGWMKKRRIRHSLCGNYTGVINRVQGI